MRVLLIEDDLEIARRLCAAFEDAGFAVDHASDGETGWELGETRTYDAAILDLGLPGVPGLDLLARWRRAGRNLPVLVLTARGAWTERVAGLNAGADDYLTKPFHAPEVLARVRALIRRSAAHSSPVLRYRDITLDVGAGTVALGGATLDLTARELKILARLMRRPGHIVSQDELADQIYPQGEARDSNTIEVFIARLRKKLGRDAIRTVRGLGYKLE
ncbi:MAG: response regulator transcription factor [Alphaproteobacteria bacterium]|nr:response regulator transcription factor [Alphaproteobacteria bacterium]